MNYFLSIIAFIATVSAASDCVKDPQIHYKKEFSLKSVVLKEELIDLNKDELHDLKITSEEQCGAKGCEGLIYLQKEKDCYKVVFSFNGSISFIKGRGPFLDILVDKKKYRFDLLRQMYE